MAIDRAAITKTIFNTPHPGQRLHLAGHRGLVGLLKGADVLKFDAKKAKELWAEADKISPWSAPSRSRTTPTAVTRPGSTRCRTQLKNNLGIDASGNPYVDFASLRKDVNAHHPDRVPHRLAGRLPGAVQLPAAALRHQGLVERQRLLEPRVRQAARQGRLGDQAAATKDYRRLRRSSSRTCPPSRCGTRTSTAASPRA
jgi:hypothetical protein